MTSAHYPKGTSMSMPTKELGRSSLCTSRIPFSHHPGVTVVSKLKRPFADTYIHEQSHVDHIGTCRSFNMG
jgi:hypothetical protein